MKLTKSNNNMKVKIKDLCEAINGSAFKPTEWSENGLKIVRIQNLNGSEVFNFYNGNIEKKVLIDNEDIVFSWSGSIGTSFGAFKWNGETALLNQHIFKIVPKENVDNHWLYFQLKYNTNKIEKLAHGAGGLVHVKKGDFESFEISLQSLSEQVKISNFLINEEKKIKKIKKILEKIEIRNQYYADKLLHGELSIINGSLINNNTELREFSINDIVLKKITKGATPSNITTEKSELNTVNYYKIETLNKKLIEKYYITEKDHEIMSRSKLKKDDILVTIAGSLGKIAIVTNENLPANINQAIAIIRVDHTKCDNKYVYHFMKTIKSQIEKNKNNGVIQNLNLETLSNFKIMLPMNISYQKNISNFLDNLENEKEKVEKLLKLEEQRFEWLSDKLLSGEYVIEGDNDVI